MATALSLRKLTEQLYTRLTFEPIRGGRWMCSFEVAVGMYTSRRSMCRKQPFGIGVTFNDAASNLAQRLRGMWVHRYMQTGDGDISIDIPRDLTP